jgi:hypothetical protein
MKKNPVLLAVGCLLLGMVGCQTDDGVQKGYLTPQQTSSDSASASTQTTSETSSSSETTGERLPPPSVTENVSTKSESTENVPTSNASESASVASKGESDASEATPTVEKSEEATEKAEAAAEKSEERSSEPVANTRRSPPQAGGKRGAAGSSLRRGTSAPSEEHQVAEVEERPEPRRTRPEPRAEEERDMDDEAPAKPKRSVSSNLSQGTTRLAEPSGDIKGVVQTVNTKAKFVVLKFQYRAIPSIGKVLSVMRNGEKVGQIKVTKPVRPPHATADILDGDIQRGDVVQ